MNSTTANIGIANADGATVSEQEFLQREADDAKTAAVRALNEAKTALIQKMDPSSIPRKHPVLTIVGATVAGFVAAAVSIPSKKEQELRRLERLRQATQPQSPNGADGKASAAKAVEKPSIWATILHELIVLIKPILLASITAGIKGATTPPPQYEPRKPM